jgi:FkbM family methyltransferase
LSFKLSIKRRVNKTLRAVLRKKEVAIHGIIVPLELIHYEQALKELDRGTYEDAEAALIARYFKPGSTVVELGASLGIISAVIGKTAPARLVCVEALPDLAAAVERMLARNCPGVSHKVIECAIGPEDGQMSFTADETDNMTGKAADSTDGKRTFQVPARRLSTILADEKITGPFHLVCDIEGMEAALFLDDAGALANCAGVILEAHPTEYKGRKFSPDEIFNLCESLGFELVERRRNAAYFKRKGR